MGVLAKPSVLRFLILCQLFAALLLPTGCSFTEHLTAGDEGRSSMLDERVKSFNRAVYWGKLSDVMEFVDEGARAGLRKGTAERARNEKLIDIQIVTVDIDPDGSQATVDVVTRYYKAPNYVVVERVEQQDWRYHRVGGGWLYHGQVVMTDSKEADVSGNWGRL